MRSRNNTKSGKDKEASAVREESKHGKGETKPTETETAIHHIDLDNVESRRFVTLKTIFNKTKRLF